MEKKLEQPMTDVINSEKSKYFLRGKKEKGSNCSKEGIKYEEQIWNVVSTCKRKDSNIFFNTQLKRELGGCSRAFDIICNWDNIKDIPIEIKKQKTPDWMQCSIIYDHKWKCSDKSTISQNAKNIFQSYIDQFNTKIFNGKIPIFFTRKITHTEWVKIKNETTDFNDQYFDCSPDTIEKLYQSKGCIYIQISEKGLYHCGKDICHFDVPEFKCRQRFRLRTKVHAKNQKGYCALSATISCQPINLKEMDDSKYSLDNYDKLPIILKHIFDPLTLTD